MSKQVEAVGDEAVSRCTAALSHLSWPEPTLIAYNLPHAGTPVALHDTNQILGNSP
jgi:hypothetical protein